MNPVMSDSGPAAARVQRDALVSLVTNIARAMQSEIPPGEIAALRRLPPGLPDSPAFWKITGLFLDPAGVLPGDSRDRDDAERRWGTILQAMATLKGLHVYGRRLGHVLAESEISEMRFLRLLRSSGERLAQELRAVVHYVGSKALATDLSDVARLILSDGGKDGEAVRRGFARDFYSRFEQS